MDANAKQLLESLKNDYINLAREKASRPFPFSTTIGNQMGGIYVRKMAGSDFFCLANIEFDPSVRGQGVLTAFINFILSNKAPYKGLMIEIIHNKRLAKHLSKLNFEVKPCDPISDAESPTLIITY